MYYHIVKKDGLKYKDLDIKEYESVIKEKTDIIINKWLDFENEIVEKPENETYFYKYQEKEDTKTVYNFDGYYKGKTINQDLQNFNFNVNYQE